MQRSRVKKLACLFIIAVLFTTGTAETQDKNVLGAVEEVMLLPWGFKFPARVDTGAATSSIDVCEIEVRKTEVHFTLADRCGGLRLILPLVETRHIQTPEGGKERPIVDMEICIGSRRIRAQVTLNDRSRLEYPFLIGRNILWENYIVDVSRSRTAPPVCPEYGSQ